MLKIFEIVKIFTRSIFQKKKLRNIRDFYSVASFITYKVGVLIIYVDYERKIRS